MIYNYNEFLNETLKKHITIYNFLGETEKIRKKVINNKLPNNVWGVILLKCKKDDNSIYNIWLKIIDVNDIKIKNDDYNNKDKTKWMISVTELKYMCCTSSVYYTEFIQIIDDLLLEYNDKIELYNELQNTKTIIINKYNSIKNYIKSNPELVKILEKLDSKDLFNAIEKIKDNENMTIRYNIISTILLGVGIDVVSDIVVPQLSSYLKMISKLFF